MFNHFRIRTNRDPVRLNRKIREFSILFLKQQLKTNKMLQWQRN